MYAVALPTAFHVKVGVALARLPDGATMVAAGGGGVAATGKVIPLLQGPLPRALGVTIQHWPAAGFSVALGTIEHVPGPRAQPARAPVEGVRGGSGALWRISSPCRSRSPTPPAPRCSLFGCARRSWLPPTPCTAWRPPRRPS